MTTAEAGRTPPITDELTEPFWAHARRGALAVQKCPDGALRWPPHPDAIHPGSAPHEWVEVSGAATLYSFSVIHRSSYDCPESPYVLAVVQLDEGLLLTSNIVDADPAALAIGQELNLRFEPLGEHALPVFSPAR